MPPHLFVPSTPGGSLKRVTGICWGTGDRVINIDGEDFIVDDKPCPVRAECEKFGDANNMLGVWGGKIRSTKVHLQGLRNGQHHDDTPVIVKGTPRSQPLELTPVKIVQDARLKKST